MSASIFADESPDPSRAHRSLPSEVDACMIAGWAGCACCMHAAVPVCAHVCVCACVYIVCVCVCVCPLSLSLCARCHFGDWECC